MALEQRQIWDHVYEKLIKHFKQGDVRVKNGTITVDCVFKQCAVIT